MLRRFFHMEKNIIAHRYFQKEKNEKKMMELIILADTYI